MASAQTLIRQAYAAFNNRDVDRALAVMSEQVDWPKASEGGRVTGKAQVRAYWKRQWADFDPYVEPIKMTEREANKTEVEVHQIVKNLSGAIISDQTLLHIFTIKNGLIERLDIGDSKPAFGHGPAKSSGV